MKSNKIVAESIPLAYNDFHPTLSLLLPMKMKKTTQQPCVACRTLSPHAHWFLRLALISVFVTAGIPKFQNLASFAEMATLPLWMAFLVALGEVGGSLLLLVGGFSKDWMTRLGALAQIPVMVGAIFLYHWGQWSMMPTESHPTGGIAFAFVLLMIQIFFLLVGNGKGTCSGCESKQ